MALKKIPTLSIEDCDKHIKKYAESGNLVAVDNWLDIRLEVMAGNNLLFASPNVVKNTKAVTSGT